MEALRMAGGTAELDPDRCIGCGLCISSCPSGALVLARKPADLQAPVPKNQREAFALRAAARARARAQLEDKLKRLRNT
jgi:ferredoxin